ncbi:MAG: response regulator [Cyanobacteriota bacterium]
MADHLSKKILIVGDNICDKFNLKKSFTYFLNNLGYNIILCSSSADAVNTIKKEQPDLVLMDIYMEHNNGIEILKEIKELKDLATIPCIMITSLRHSRKLIDALQIGAADYIIKTGTSAQVVNNKIMKVFNGAA